MPTHPVKARVQKRVAQSIAPLRAFAAESKARRDARKLNEFYDFLDTLDDQDDQDASGWLAELDAESDRLRRRADLMEPFEDEVAAYMKSSRGRLGSMRADHKVYHPPTPPIPSSKASMASRGDSSAANGRVPSFSGDSGYFSRAGPTSPAPATRVRIDERSLSGGAQRPPHRSRSGGSHSSALLTSSRPISRSASSARVTGNERWDSDQQRMSKFLADDDDKATLEAWARKVERDILKRERQS